MRLLEGRKDDILKKYMQDFDVDVLDVVLNDPFIKSTNYKYADWILGHLDWSTTPHALEVLELVKEFDRVGKNLEIKDLNQYPDVNELRHALKKYTSKSQEKKIDSDAKKVYEDGRVLIVKPLSHKASCKYGAGTKWCTTMESPGYYEKHTSGGLELFYIIMKGVDSSNKFYKIAINKRGDSETWWDAVDTPMPPREVELIKVGLGKKAISAIEENHTSAFPLHDFFNHKENVSFVSEPIFGTDYKLAVIFTPPYLFDKEERLFGFEYELKLSKGIKNESDYDIIHHGKTIEMGHGYFGYEFDYSKDSIITRGGLGENDEFEPPVYLSEIYNIKTIEDYWGLTGGITPYQFYSKIKWSIFYALSTSENLMKYIFGNKKTWYPNRPSYGFTFKRKDGLISKLVDYLDSGKEGNAIDFLIDVGKIKVEISPDGEKKYVGKQGYITPKGYFSAFFASAVRAGILSYTRKNKKNILSKGPNFDDFKEGNLVAL